MSGSGEDLSALVGARAEVTHVVTDHMTAIAAGSGDLPVLATPTLIALLESAACKAVASHLHGGQTSVGSRVDVRHLAPSPVGAQVTATARVTDVSGMRLTFDVEASHHVDGRTVQVATGTHQRVVVDRGGFLTSLRAGAL